METKRNVQDITRAALMSLLLAALLAAGLPAFAQSPPGVPTPADAAPAPSATTAEPTSRDATLQQRWVRVLDRVNEQLKQNDLSPAVLRNLEQTVYLVRNLVDAARGPYSVTLTRSSPSSAPSDRGQGGRAAGDSERCGAAP